MAIAVPVAVMPDVKGTFGPLLAPENAGSPVVALPVGVTVVLLGLSTLFRETELSDSVVRGKKGASDQGEGK